jgi:hypothetical protein
MLLVVEIPWIARARSFEREQRSLSFVSALRICYEVVSLSVPPARPCSCFPVLSVVIAKELRISLITCTRAARANNKLILPQRCVGMMEVKAMKEDPALLGRPPHEEAGCETV